VLFMVIVIMKYKGHSQFQFVAGYVKRSACRCVSYYNPTLQNPLGVI